ncbi:MAG: PqqD family peptide modification chaperone [Vulcanimicrobiota bacterium]
MTQLKPTSIVTPSESVVATELDGEIVMMSVESGNYFGLDAIATDVWKLVDGQRSVAQIVDQLCQEYEVDGQECLDHVLELFERMHEQGVIRA